MLDNYKNWAEGKMKNLDVWDMKLIKWSVAAFTLFIAKIWPPILGLEWYWYVALGVLFMARPMKKALM